MMKKYIRDSLIKVYNFRCQYCETVFQPSNLHIDHIIPLSKNGGNELDNLTVACARCNSKKSDLMIRAGFIEILKARAQKKKQLVEIHLERINSSKEAPKIKLIEPTHYVKCSCDQHKLVYIGDEINETGWILLNLLIGYATFNSSVSLSPTDWPIPWAIYYIGPEITHDLSQYLQIESAFLGHLINEYSKINLRSEVCSTNLYFHSGFLTLNDGTCLTRISFPHKIPECILNASVFQKYTEHKDRFQKWESDQNLVSQEFQKANLLLEKTFTGDIRNTHG